MKTPDSKKGKDGKNAAKVDGTRLTPGFAKAKVVKKTGAGLTITVSCVNGDSNRSFTSTIRGELKYYNTRETVSADAEIGVYLPDGTNIDVNYIFPWAANQPDPLRLGGGIIKGSLSEGSQRVMGSTDPLQAPFVKTEWVNGTAWGVAVFLTPPAGAAYYEGDVIFGLAIVDPVTRNLAVTPFTLREGDCLDTIA